MPFRAQLISLLLVVLAASGAGALAADAPNPALEAAIHGPQRTPTFVERDPSRHPAEELSFFGVKPEDTVVEIWPFGGYWTEILAAYIDDHGKLYEAVQPAAPTGPEAGMLEKFKQKLAADPKTYGHVVLTTFGKDEYDIVPAGTADVVLTFRNLHNWMRQGYAEAALAAFYKALKPGGILGMEDHRGKGDKPQDAKAPTGYVQQDYAIELAKKAGFEFVAASEINANPKDTADWPKGVWTLPPTFALGDQDRAKYAAIGEADNFVLKFRKPAR